MFRLSTFAFLFTFLVCPLCTLAMSPKKYGKNMAREHKKDRPDAAPSTFVKPRTPVKGNTVVYGKIGKMALKGYLARPRKASKNLPALIVIHEWWGLNDNIRAMTRRLAGEGYLALAVDLYEGKSATKPKQAYKLMMGAFKRSPRLVRHLKQAFAFLKTKHKATRIGSLGWCFGGAWSLRTGMALPAKLNAMVIYYGRLITSKKKLAPLKMPILGIFGGKDRGIPLKSVRLFEKNLKALKKNVQIHVYKNANHAFANPSGKRFRLKDARNAWKKTVRFLNKHLKK